MKKMNLFKTNKKDKISEEKKTGNSKKDGIDFPKITPEIIKMFFEECDTEDQDSGIMKIGENRYSICLEYSDVSFSKENLENQISVFLKYVDYLNSFSEDDHIQVIHTGVPVSTQKYKKDFLYEINSDMTENEVKIANEFNSLIENCIGHKEETSCETRLIVLSTKAESWGDAKDIFLQYQLKSEEKFKMLKSKIRRWTTYERLEMLYNIFHINSLKADYPDVTDLFAYTKEQGISIYDFLAPKEVNPREKSYITIEDKKFVSVLFVSQLPHSMTPRFYNKITQVENANIVVTENITPINPAMAIKKIDKKISGMKTERLNRIKRALKSGYAYEAVKDQKLEDKLEDAINLREALTKKKQKLFQKNILICITAETKKELNIVIKKVKDIASEHLISIAPLDWQQLEGLKNLLPFGYNTLQFQRSLTSEAVATSVPFNTKQLIMPRSIYYGMDLVSKLMVFADRKKLKNGNGCVLSPSGSGKSFFVKLNIEQILLRYPEDEVIVLDPMNEYGEVVSAYGGQTIKISTTSKTYINPFDITLNPSTDYLPEEDEPVKVKTEYVLAFIESIVGSRGLSGEEKSLIDRCTRRLFEKVEENSDYTPDFPAFYEELKTYDEPEAKKLVLILERYITGAMNIFSKKTNVHLENRFICFDVSELTTSLKTTGYLVILEHIMNRLRENRNSGRNTWIFIDEFHVLLSNQYSAEYITRIYKMGRKLGALPTIISQNIGGILSTEQGREILSNSEFAVILKQKPIELPAICRIFNITDEESKYIMDPPVGQGLLVYGDDIVAFKNTIPEKYYIYSLNQTSNVQKGRD